MTACADCPQKDKRIAQLERDLEAAALAVDQMTARWLAVKEGKGANGK